MPAAKTTAKIPLCLSSQPISCVPEAMNKSQFPSPEDHVWVAVVSIIWGEAMQAFSSRILEREYDLKWKYFFPSSCSKWVQG